METAGWGRIKYRVAPTILSDARICFAGWLWNRSGETTNLDIYVTRAFRVAFAADVLFWIGLIVVGRL